MGTVATIATGTDQMTKLVASLNSLVNSNNTIGNYSSTTSVSVSGTATAPTAIPFDSNDKQEGLLTHSATTNTTRFTCTAPGNYIFAAQLQVEHLTTGTAPLIVWFRKNGTTEITNSAARIKMNGVANTDVLVVECNVPMIATDYVEILCLSTTASEWQLTATAASGTSPNVVPVTPACILTAICLPA